MARYYAIHKPYGMLSQFSPEGGRETLAALGDFEKDVYPVGRLDADSEGLLILTNDTSLNAQLLDPRHGHERTYWIQVDREIDEDALSELRKGVAINIKGKPYFTSPAKASRIYPEIPERNPPVRFRKSVPTSWIELLITEGKNRQVRRMTAQVGFPTLRLIRVKIGNLSLHSFEPGSIKEYSKQEIYSSLGLK